MKVFELKNIIILRIYLCKYKKYMGHFSVSFEYKVDNIYITIEIPH